MSEVTRIAWRAKGDRVRMKPSHPVVSLGSGAKVGGASRHAMFYREYHAIGAVRATKMRASYSTLLAYISGKNPRSRP